MRPAGNAALTSNLNRPHSRGTLTGGFSGSLTAIGGNGDIAAFRNASAAAVAPLVPRNMIIPAIDLSWSTDTAFAGPGLRIGLWKVTGFTVLHTTGTGLKTLVPLPKSTDGPDVLTDFQCIIGGSTAISGQTYTARNADSPFFVFSPEGGTSPSGNARWEAGVGQLPIVLLPNEGIVAAVLNMAATGVGVFSFNPELQTAQ